MKNNASMETRTPGIARKYSLPIAILAIVLVVAAGPIAATFSVFADHSHKRLQLHVRSDLNFGRLSSESTDTKTFENALVVGKGKTSAIGFAFVSGATTWDKVFSGISIVVQNHREENGEGNHGHGSGHDDGSGSIMAEEKGRGNHGHKSGTDNGRSSDTDDEFHAQVACISLGTGVCPEGLPAAFTPRASTTYDYVVSFTTVSTIPSGVTLQTTVSAS